LLDECEGDLREELKLCSQVFRAISLPGLAKFLREELSQNFVLKSTTEYKCAPDDGS
jgi:hypothetical protein